MCDEEKVLELIECKGRRTIKEIAEELGIGIITANKIVFGLMAKGEIREVSTSRGKYYALSLKNSKVLNNDVNPEIDSNMGGNKGKDTEDSVEGNIYKIEDSIYNAQDNALDIKEEIDRVKEQVGRIYVDFISLMSIFVAVFSLISVNSNIIMAISEKNISNVVLTTVIVNISVCVCMSLFVFFIRLIVLIPVKEKKIKQKKIKEKKKRK